MTDSGIRFGLGAVKNVGRATIDEIVKEREKDGPFRSIFELAERVSHEALNRRVLESLVSAGAMDTLHESRSRQHAGVAHALEAGSRHQHDEAMGQESIFGMAPTVTR